MPKHVKMRPLFEPHQFNGTPGIIGGNCRECGGPITEPWHQNVPKVSEEKYEELDRWQIRELYNCKRCGSVVNDKELHDQWHEHEAEQC